MIFARAASNWGIASAMVALVLATSACSSGLPSTNFSRVQSDAARTMTIPDGNSLIYIYRPSSQHSLVDYDVKIDGRQAFSVSINEFIRYVGPPGSKEISAEAGNVDILRLTVDSGQRYYIRMEAHGGSFPSRVVLVNVPEQLGSKEIAGLQLAHEITDVAHGELVGSQSQASKVQSNSRSRQTSKDLQDRELIAVLDLKPFGVSNEEAVVTSDRLREELFKTNWFRIVNRSQISAVLDEQALQQTGCTEAECAIEVGRILGVHRIVAGKLTRVGAMNWIVSVIMVDVETAEVLRSESVRHRGDFLQFIDESIARLARELSGG